MAWIDLPCGCRINDAFVLAMCGRHVMDYDQKCREEQAAYEKYERMMRGASPQPAEPK